MILVHNNVIDTSRQTVKDINAGADSIILHSFQ